jgi:diadenosine tetraphosphate (Ap4A) HIT family hydrolase
MSLCTTCELVARRDSGQAPVWDAIYRTEHWDVVHSFNTALLGWLVLVARRHVEAVADLTEEEALELGALVRRVSQAIHATTGCAKTYVVQFAEAAGHAHVHVHLIARMPDLPADRRGPRIFGYLGVPDEERVSEAAMDHLALQIRAALE